jgi:hypothetical protein
MKKQHLATYFFISFLLTSFLFAKPIFAVTDHVDLLARYPASLVNDPTKPDLSYTWSFSKEDIYL